jgi:hypothetical protein
MNAFSFPKLDLRRASSPLMFSADFFNQRSWQLIYRDPLLNFSISQISITALIRKEKITSPPTRLATRGRVQACTGGFPPGAVFDSR